MPTSRWLREQGVPVHLLGTSEHPLPLSVAAAWAIERGERPEPSRIAYLLRSGLPLPPVLLYYAADLLEGKIKRPGRKRKTETQRILTEIGNESLAERVAELELGNARAGYRDPYTRAVRHVAKEIHKGEATVKNRIRPYRQLGAK
jgi:hypothetical protein